MERAFKFEIPNDGPLVPCLVLHAAFIYNRQLTRLGSDYGFLGKDDGRAMPALVSNDSKLPWIAATVVPCKGVESACAVEFAGKSPENARTQ